MKILIKSAHIVDPKGPHHQTVKDIQIQNSSIEKIADYIEAPQDYKIINIPNLKISPGWFDESVCFGEPGFEDRENINNGLQVAALSGFTGVALQPNTFPVIDHQSLVSFVKDKAKHHLVTLYPIGAFTKNSEGLDMAELFDMKNAGAIAFGDYKKDIAHANVLKIGLQYTQDFNALLVVFAQEASIKGHGVVHEGVVSTALGLKGIPELAESISIARNLKLLEYTGGKMHIPTISTPASVQLIKEAKAKGLKVTCSVAIHQLLLKDTLLESFDTRYKVSPPLRDENTIKILINAILDGTIDSITSDHNPIDIEGKKMEFDNAKNGTIGLESAFGALHSILPYEVVVEKLTQAKNIFGLEQHHIMEGATADLTLFETDSTWTFDRNHIKSKSKNSAFLGIAMKGKALGVINKSQIILA